MVLELYLFMDFIQNLASSLRTQNRRVYKIYPGFSKFIIARLMFPLSIQRRKMGEHFPQNINVMIYLSVIITLVSLAQS